MQIAPITGDTVVHLIGAGFSALIAYLVLLMRNGQKDAQIEQNKVTQTILDKQNELQADFSRKHAENAQALAVHIAEDKGEIGIVKSILNRVEGKVDEINRNGRH